MRQSLTKLFNKRWFAVLLCVVGVIASTLLNTRVKLGGECGELFDSFYENSGSEVSIGSQLQSIGNAVTGLAAIAGHYGLDSTAAHDATETMRLGLVYSPKDASYLHWCYRSLLDAADDLIGRLEQAQLSKRDSENLTLYAESIEQSRSGIEANSYNANVQAFLRRNSAFPTAGIAAFAGVTMPELFQ